MCRKKIRKGNIIYELKLKEESSKYNQIEKFIQTKKYKYI